MSQRSKTEVCNTMRNLMTNSSFLEFFKVTFCNEQIVADIVSRACLPRRGSSYIEINDRIRIIFT